MKKIVLSTLLIFIILSCERNLNDSLSEDPQIYFEQSNNFYSDSLLIEVTYNGQKFIEGFFQEDLSNIVFNQIGEFKEFNHIYSWYEPSVTLEDSARKLVNRRLLSLGIDTISVIQGNHTEKYFEFLYPNYLVSQNKDFHFRVHKSSYFEGIYYSTEDGTRNQIVQIGSVNVNEMSSNIIKELFERLWYYRFYNNKGAKVLESYISKKDNYYLYVIYYITIVYGDYGIRDEISLIKSEYLLSEQSGNTLIKNQNLKIVDGHSN